MVDIAPSTIFRQCTECGALEPAARVVCADCGSMAFEPAETRNEGTLLSWTIVRRPTDTFKHLGAIPIAAVRLDGGLTLTGRLQGDIETLSVGSRVTLSGDEAGVPLFSIAEL
jgi:uncharacterized OB-fold protein